MAATETLNLIDVAARLVTTGARHGSPSMLMRRIGQDHGISITFDVARHILAQLYAAGIVGAVDTTTLAHPVLLDHEQAAEVLENYRSVGSTDWATFYECPTCCRTAPWTDGRMTAAGDEEDEFWCQTCGAEAPLVACRKL